MSERISTCNEQLDTLLDGGFLRNSMILLAGNPGAGKTILSSNFIYEGALNFDEPGVYACFAETRKRLIQDMKKFGIDFEPLIRRRKVEVLDLSIGSETEVQSALNQIFESITTLRAKRLVVDSIAAMAMGLETEYEKRHLIRLLYRLILKTGCTTIAITDIPWNSEKIGESIEEFVADGIVMMEHNYNNEGNLTRRLRITKMRGTNHSKKTHSYTINAEGLDIEI
ncbi:MAG: AAA family ATPase [Candidatus Bathyarchaeota archaeon]|nr:AAA family ATPase [Candidatus Bathyarchaeota archaeon]